MTQTSRKSDNNKMEGYYNAFGPYVRKVMGFTTYKVNVDAGFTCPNRDGTVALGGCIYCNNDSFRPSSCKPSLSVSSQVENGIAYLTKRYKAKKFIAYFQPYTNTYAPVEELERLYLEALSSHQDVIGIAVGTRPDAVDDDKINMLSRLAKRYFVLIEYGLQSIYDKSLEFINRGHDYACFLNALDMTVNKGIFVGAHLIMGFPTETKTEMLAMADEVSTLPLDFLKIHQLQIISGTVLADIYDRERFYVFGYDEYLDFLVEFIEKLNPNIALQRLFATAPDDILIAPIWNKSRQMITRDIEKRFKDRNTHQGRKYRNDCVRLINAKPF
ncbi:radical SAM protein, family [Candidatus Magnetoovum chiemensis]|nr:radical SAM protein, family [Candidatus Magnetoovum chiemensis]